LIGYGDTVVRILQKNIRIEKQAIFNASGVATAVLQVPLGPSWEVKQISVKTTVTANQTTCRTFIGQSDAGIFISNTLIGNADTDSQPNVTVRSGDSLCAVWTGGTAGRIATMTVVYDEVAY
jgi:hypothetical protein